eukprot:22021-Pleurochrysis_carterae.AAC.3
MHAAPHTCVVSARTPAVLRARRHSTGRTLLRTPACGQRAGACRLRAPYARYCAHLRVVSARALAICEPHRGAGRKLFRTPACGRRADVCRPRAPTQYRTHAIMFACARSVLRRLRSSAPR